MANPLHNQVSLSSSAQQVDPQQTASGCTVFMIKAPLSNAQPAFVGASTVTLSNGHQLDPGDQITYERDSQTGQPQYQMRPSAFWVVGTSGDVVTWLALS